MGLSVFFSLNSMFHTFIFFLRFPNIFYFLCFISCFSDPVKSNAVWTSNKYTWMILYHLHHVDCWSLRHFSQFPMQFIAKYHNWEKHFTISPSLSLSLFRSMTRRYIWVKLRPLKLRRFSWKSILFREILFSVADQRSSPIFMAVYEFVVDFDFCLFRLNHWTRNIFWATSKEFHENRD